MKNRWKKIKQTDAFRVKMPKSTQDATEISEFSANGLAKNRTNNCYTKTYRISDANFNIASDEEKMRMLLAYCRLLNSYHQKFFMTLNNKNRDMKKLRDDVLLDYMADGMDDLRDAMNDVIEDSLKEGRQGLEKEIYITVRCDTAKTYEEANIFFNTLEGNMERSFKEMGSTLIPLNAEERLRIIHNIYRMGKEDEFHFDMKEAIEKGIDFKDIIAPTYMNFKDSDNSFTCDGKKASALYVKYYPSSIKEPFLPGLLANNISMMVTMDVVPVSREDAEKKTRDLYMGIQKEIRGQNKKRLKNRDYSSEISYSVQMEQEEIKELMNDIRNGDQHLFWVNVVILVIADSQKELEEDVEVLRQYMSNCGITIDYLYCQQREGLNTVLPLGVRQLGTGWLMETKSMPVFYPFNVMELMMPEGTYYGINKESKNPCIGNRKKLINANGIFLGTTGSGKTTLAKCEMLQQRLRGEDHIFGIDPKGDYRYLAEETNGEVIELSTTTENYINVLAYFDESRRHTIANEKSEVVHAMFEICKKDKLTSVEDNVVDRALIELYKPDALGDKPIEEHTLVDLKEELDKIANNKQCSTYEVDAAIKLGIYLQRFTEGTYGIFAHKTNIDVNNKMIIFDLSKLGDGLWDMGMLIMLEYIQENILKNYNANRATWIYIDELHILLAHPAAQSYLLALWKKVRSLGGICTGITQNLGDIEINSTTKAILENSEFVAILKSDVSRNDSLVEMLGITETQAKSITSETRPGRGLLRFGQSVVSFDATLPKDSLIYKITDTNAHEKFEKAKKKGK